MLRFRPTNNCSATGRFVAVHLCDTARHTYPPRPARAREPDTREPPDSRREYIAGIAAEAAAECPLLIKDKEASGATVEDAETLAAYARLVRGTVGYNDFVADAIA